MKKYRNNLNANISNIDAPSVKTWLTNHTYPLWLASGVNWQQGGFYECLSLDGKPMHETPRRAMVQARQLYCLRVGLEKGYSDPTLAKKAIDAGIPFLLHHYSHPSGAFIHSIDQQLQPFNSTHDLYAQAFALFGMAHAYALTQTPEIKNRALKLIDYLRKTRSALGGGFTEINNHQEIIYISNPHMHLFEAAIAWMEVDSDNTWRHLADDMLELCLSKFIQDNGLICEYFHAKWHPIVTDNKFVFEPGHQYEWAWLMGKYQKLTHVNLHATRYHLFKSSEENGIHPTHRTAYDEVWSNLTPKRHTSRFWPQCERIKIALQLGCECSLEEKTYFAQAADEALKALFGFFNLPIQGLWYDVLQESGEYVTQPAKASSFYHIIGALSDYIELRDELTPQPSASHTSTQVIRSQ